MNKLEQRMVAAVESCREWSEKDLTVSVQFGRLRVMIGEVVIAHKPNLLVPGGLYPCFAAWQNHKSKVYASRMRALGFRYCRTSDSWRGPNGEG